MLRTCERRLTAIMLTFSLYIASPVLFDQFLYSALKSGEFPPKSDSIGIPLAWFMLLWLIALPFIVVLCGLIEILGRKYYGSDS